MQPESRDDTGVGTVERSRSASVSSGRAKCRKRFDQHTCVRNGPVPEGRNTSGRHLTPQQVMITMVGWSQRCRATAPVAPDGAVDSSSSTPAPPTHMSMPSADRLGPTPPPVEMITVSRKRILSWDGGGPGPEPSWSTARPRLHPVAQLQLGQHPGHVGLQVPHSPRRLDETGFMDADGHLDPVRGVQLDQDV